MKMKNIIKLVSYLLIAGFAFGLGLFYTKDKHQNISKAGIAEKTGRVYTCSMHPQIRQDKPGKCPICFMDLVPVDSAENKGSVGEISFSDEAIALMEVETDKVERKQLRRELSLFGKLEYDETKVKDITAWTAGRIEKLYFDFTGVTVVKGEPMVEIYSPELLAAQSEFLESLEFVKRTSGSSDVLKRSAIATLSAARDKLILLGLTETQIKKIEENAKASDVVVVNAPLTGVVIDKSASQGEYVSVGSKIYSIANLDKLWLMLQAYESDAVWLKEGQLVEFITESFPSEIFTGEISFVSPILDEETRSFVLRVIVGNDDNKLKPGMFARATIKSEGFAEAKENDSPLVIPVTAPLFTGKRSIVYVKVPNMEKPTFEMREVRIGAQGGDYYEVLEGLKEGEEVVARGNFKIDSSLQIQGKMSMMSPRDSDSVESGVKQEQTHCPVMGGKINKDYFILYKGVKVYFCCPGCEKVFLESPEKYIDKLPQFRGQENDDFN